MAGRRQGWKRLGLVVVGVAALAAIAGVGATVSNSIDGANIVDGSIGPMKIRADSLGLGRISPNAQRALTNVSAVGTGSTNWVYWHYTGDGTTHPPAEVGASAKATIQARAGERVIARLDALVRKTVEGPAGGQESGTKIQCDIHSSVSSSGSYRNIYTSNGEASTSIPLVIDVKQTGPIDILGVCDEWDNATVTARADVTVTAETTIPSS